MGKNCINWQTNLKRRWGGKPIAHWGGMEIKDYVSFKYDIWINFYFTESGVEF